MARLRRSDRVHLLAPGLGRKMFGLFVGCAMVPILVLSLLAWDRVGNELEDQSRTRLHHAARRTGMLLLERLSGIEKALAEDAVARSTGRVLEVRPLGDAPAPAGRSESGTPSAEASSIDPGRPHLFVLQQGTEPEIWLTSPASADRRGTAARIDARFLFDISHQNALSPAGEVCIVTDDGRVVFRSHPDFDCVPSRIGRTGSPDLESRVIAGEDYLTLEWLLFLDAAFQSPGWTVVVAEPRLLVMAPVMTFRLLVLLVSAFAVFGAALLAAHFIRRQLEPLAALESAADRVRSGQLAVAVPVESQDELGRVSEAFNQMSRHLAIEFESLQGLIEMDRSILSARSREDLIAATLDGIEHIGGSPEIGLALPADLDVSGDEWTIVRRSPGRADLVLDFPMWMLASTAWFDADSDSMVVETADLDPELRRALGGELEAIEILPLRAEGRLVGLVCLESGEASMRVGSSPLRLRQLCNQIASAVHGLELRTENEHLRSYDASTGLPNRAAYEEALATAMAGSGGRPLSVIRISITGMPRYANTYGHAGSERVLRGVAEVLSARDDLEAARADSVSFGAFFIAPDMDSIIGRIRAVAGQVRRMLDGLPGSHGLGVVVGATLQGLDGVDASDLIGKAEVASRHVVGVGVDSIEFFSDEMERTYRKASEVESSLEHAIDAGHLRLEYQPIVDAQTRQLVGGEALLRWTCPVRGVIPPDVFIGIAEESGLIQRLGEWALRRAFADIGEWRGRGLQPVRISVNVSASQVTRSLCDLVADLIQIGQARPEDIGLELTESDVLVESERAQRVLQQIRKMGLTISIDDFGTGYSSLDYLRRFEVDVVKIDRSFLQGVPENESDRDLTRAAIAVGRALGLRTIAEGCETEEQLQFLRDAQCDSVQGWLFGAAMSASDFAKLIAEANDLRRLQG